MPVPAGSFNGATMVLRKAGRETNAGSNFWGCPTYPQCRGTRSLRGTNRLTISVYLSNQVLTLILILTA
jgi:ssDNA-binding Zn-finger/Zn-ribbon topoisomerase 1